VRGLYARLTKDGVDAWLDKAKTCGERNRTILPDHIHADFTIKTINAIRDNAPDVKPPFIDAPFTESHGFLLPL
jgi:hypothetical protein